MVSLKIYTIEKKGCDYDMCKSLKLGWNEPLSEEH